MPLAALHGVTGFVRWHMKTLNFCNLPLQPLFHYHSFVAQLPKVNFHLIQILVFETSHAAKALPLSNAFSQQQFLNFEMYLQFKSVAFARNPTCHSKPDSYRSHTVRKILEGCPDVALLKMLTSFWDYVTLDFDSTGGLNTPNCGTQFVYQYMVIGILRTWYKKCHRMVQVIKQVMLTPINWNVSATYQ